MTLEQKVRVALVYVYIWETIEMTKEKLSNLQKYLDKLVERNLSPPSGKHKDHPVELKRFLLNEIRLVKATIDKAKS
jgi:hypothetical protein